MLFLPHTNTVMLLEPYCGTITEPGLPTFIPGKRRKTGALLGGICLNGLDFLLFSFSSCSCEIRLLYVCVLVYWMQLSTHLRALFLKKKMLSPQNRLATSSKTRKFPRGALHHECITVLNASKYCTGLLLENPTGP